MSWKHFDSDYQMEEHTGIFDRKVIVLKDCNGRVSLTNNMEAVMSFEWDELIEQGKNPQDFLFIYRDSEGNYDGVYYNPQVKKVEFYPIRTKFLTDAIEKAIILNS